MKWLYSQGPKGSMSDLFQKQAFNRKYGWFRQREAWEEVSIFSLKCDVLPELG